MFQKLAVPTFWLIALEGKKVWLKVIPRWKDDSEWKKTKLKKFSKHSKMKMKNEDKKNQDFFTALQSGSILPVFAHFCPFLAYFEGL